MKHWYFFIIWQPCGREFFAERYCRKKDLPSVVNHLGRYYNAKTIRYFKMGKNCYQRFIGDSIEKGE